MNGAAPVMQNHLESVGSNDGKGLECFLQVVGPAAIEKGPSSTAFRPLHPSHADFEVGHRQRPGRPLVGRNLIGVENDGFLRRFLESSAAWFVGLDVWQVIETWWKPPCGCRFFAHLDLVKALEASGFLTPRRGWLSRHG